MPHGDVETYHQDGKWHNRIEGEDAFGDSHDTREPAVEEGRREARQRQVEHIIKRVDGAIGERNSYGNDPRNVPG